MTTFSRNIAFGALACGLSIVQPQKTEALRYVTLESKYGLLEYIISDTIKECKSDVCAVMQKGRITFIKERVREIAIDACLEKYFITTFCIEPVYKEGLLIVLEDDINSIDFIKLRKRLLTKVSKLPKYHSNIQISGSPLFVEAYKGLEDINLGE